MRLPCKCVLSCSILAALVLCGSAMTHDLLKSRARWEWSLPQGKGKENSGTFTGWLSGGLTVGRGETEKDRTHIGQWSSPAANEVHLKINTGPLAGITHAKLTKPQPPTFEGELQHKSGKKEKIVLQLFKD